MNYDATMEERREMVHISNYVFHLSYIVYVIEILTSFAKRTKGNTYTTRLAKLKQEQFYDESWETWLELLHSFESFKSGKEYDGFVNKSLIERVYNAIEKEKQNEDSLRH
jgi:hypothetical protein